MTGNGNRVARYTYDPWGKPLSVTDGNGNAVSANHIANLNPLRYRGYYYDAETGFYYLQSRYYDPTTGRFLNADGYVSTGQGMTGYNMFAYCGNNPINRADPRGESFILATFIVVGVTAFISCASSDGRARTSEVFQNPNLYTIGNWLTLGSFDTIKGAFSPEEPLSVRHWMDSAATVTMLVPWVRSVGKLPWRAVSVKTNASKLVGSPFMTGQRVGFSQVGVDPNTLKVNTPINPVKYASAKAKIDAEGMYGIIEVYSDGRVYNGNHRTIIAREQGIAVDTWVKYYK